MTDRETILDWLRSGVVKISFEKKDGTERVMMCTLAQDKIPEDKLPKGTGQSSNDDVQKVFDVEKQDWRSFRWDSLKSFDNV